MTTKKQGNTYEHEANQVSVEQAIEVLPQIQPKDIIASVFVADMTKKKIAELKKAYPKSKVPDMTVEENFKAARKTRTEMNNTVKSIKERKIAFNRMVDEYAGEISDQVVSIYTPYVDAFLEEDKRRKAEKEKAAKELEALLNKQRLEIQELNTFVNSCTGKNSQFIADTLESVDLVDTSVFHKDLIHEAIEAKDKIVTRLNEMYQAQKAKEAVEAERAQLEAEAAEQAKRAAVQERVTKLQSIPMSMFGKNSLEIEHKISKIKEIEISESEFFERAAEVEGYKAVVIQQLESMLGQAVMVEQAQEQQRVMQEQQAQQEQSQVEILQADVNQAAEQDAQTEAFEAQEQEVYQEPANEVGAFIPDANEPLLGDSIKSNIFESQEKESSPNFLMSSYQPLELWPSDDSKSQNQELSEVCEKLEEAEAYIAELEEQLGL